MGFWLVSAMIGQKKSFHAMTKASMPSTAIAGRAVGITIDRKMRKLPAPSIVAASISSSGIAIRRYWRMNTTPNAVTSVGRITGWSWFTQCSLAISMKRGTTPSCDGTIMVASTRARSAVAPRNRSLANAKPASVQKNTVPSAIEPETIVEFTIAFTMSTWEPPRGCCRSGCRRA